MFIPHEIHIGEVFIPPLVIAGFLGLLGAAVTGKLLNKYRLAKHFFFPPLAYVALMVIYTVLIGLLIIPF